jgi:hypothetical protein
MLRLLALALASAAVLVGGAGATTSSPTEPFVSLQVGAKTYPLYWITSMSSVRTADGQHHNVVADGFGLAVPRQHSPRLRFGQTVTLRLTRLVDKLTISVGRQSVTLTPAEHVVAWRVSASGRYMLGVDAEWTDYGENGAYEHVHTGYGRLIHVTRPR